MALIPPKSTTEVLYFTNRATPDGMRIKAWVYKKDCPKCKKAKMGKPVDKGKVKIRATEYICPACSYTEEKKVHEESLTLEAQYTCPSCKKQGEAKTPYKRKAYLGTQAYVIECQHCGSKIAITKKMKDPKKKGAAAEEAEDADEI